MDAYKFESREDTARSLIRLIRPLKEYYSSGRAFLNIGNKGVHYGSRVAAMEGFARVLWGLGPLFSQLSSYEDEGIRREAEEWRSLVLKGLTSGTDPENIEYWGDMADYDQRIVEAAAIVVMFTLNQDMWHGLEPAVKSNVYRWLNQMNGCEMPRNNWRFFRILTNMAFQLLNLPYSMEKVREDKKLVEDSCLSGGWYVDGGRDKMDYYIAFAFHFYGQIYAAFMKEMDPEWSETLKSRGEAFARDYLYFFANDGSSIPFGRSLTYRFAHCSFWGAYAFSGASGIDYGVIKNIVVSHMEEWFQKPILDHGGIMTVGYSYPNLIMSEHYNGGGSPYWALKAFLILALPADHDFWKAERKAFPYQKQKKLLQPHMIITHDEHGCIMAYTAGQHCPGNHGHVSEKYEKFVYSNRFGFSISRGQELNDGAFDNTIAFSHGGENRYTMMHGCKAFAVEDDYLKAVYEPISGVKAESIIVPCSPWHVRIHRIACEGDIDVSDGGFSIPAENSSGIKYRDSQIEKTGQSAAARFPWGISGIISLTGGEAEVLQCFPNTNILYPLTVMPLVKHHLEKGTHLLINCVFGDISKEAEGLYLQRPEVSVEDGMVMVNCNGKKINVQL